MTVEFGVGLTSLAELYLIRRQKLYMCVCSEQCRMKRKRKRKTKKMIDLFFGQG